MGPPRSGVVRNFRAVYIPIDIPHMSTAALGLHIVDFQCPLARPHYTDRYVYYGP